MAYSDNFPTQRAVFTLDAANAGRLDPRCSFTRASTGTYFGTDKVLGSENLLTYSNPNGAAWNESNGATVSTNASAAPDGTTTASSIVEDSANSQHRTFASINATSGQTYTLVAYLKANGRTIAQVATSGAVSSNVEFDLSSSGTATTRSGSPANSSISQIGSTGWYKCSFQVTAGSTATLYLNVYLCDSANSNSYTGDGSSGVYAYGFNLSTTGQLVHEDTNGQIARSYQTKLQTAASGAARFEHSATDGQSGAKGLLIEGQVQNLFGYTEDFTQSDWTPTTSAITTGAAVAPSGDLTANLVVPNSGASFGQFYQTETLNSGTVYTLSFFAKNAGWGSGISLFFGTTGPWGSTGDQRYAQFNLSTGEAVLESGGVTGSSEDVGNGWRRYSVTTPATTVTTSAFPGLAVVNLSGSSITGDGYSGVLAWGAQLVPLSFSGSYVGSSSSSGATKALDSLSVATADIGYTGGPFTIVSETEGGTGFYPRAWTITDGTVDNRVGIHRSSPAASTSTNWLAFVVSDGSTQASSTTSSSASADKLAVSVDTNDVVFCASGSTFGTDGSAVLPDGLTTIYIGANYAGGQQLNGHYKRFAIYNEALSDTNLQALTS